jgi:hypothetical protein
VLEKVGNNIVVYVVVREAGQILYYSHQVTQDITDIALFWYWMHILREPV